MMGVERGCDKRNGLLDSVFHNVVREFGAVRVGDGEVCELLQRLSHHQVMVEFGMDWW